MRLECALAALSLCLLLSLSAAHAQEERWADNFLSDGLAPFHVPSGPGEIREVSSIENVWNSVKDFFVMSPSVEDERQQQIDAIRLLRELRDGRAFFTLMRVSRFDGKYSQGVQEEARWALIDLMDVFNEEQQKQVLNSFDRDLEAIARFYKLKDGSLGPVGEEAKQNIERVISKAEKKIQDIEQGGFPKAEKPNLCLLNYREAAKAVAKFPVEVVCGTIRTFLYSPLKAGWRFSSGIAVSLKDAIIDIPGEIAGAFTAGAYGSRGAQLGSRVANTASWAIPALKVGRRMMKGKVFEAEVGLLPELVDSPKTMERFVTGKLRGRPREAYVERLREDEALRLEIMKVRGNQKMWGFLELPDVSLRAEQLAVKIVKRINRGNLHYPGDPYILKAEREPRFRTERDMAYSAAIRLCDDLLKLGELEDFALQNRHITENNLRNARIVETQFDRSPLDWAGFAARWKEITTITETGKYPVVKGRMNPIWIDGVDATQYNFLSGN